MKARKGDIKVMTATIERMMEARASKREALYLRLPLAMANRLSHVGASASWCFLVLYSMQQLSPSRDGYFWVRADFEEDINRGSRWWQAQTTALAAAGVIDVKRAVGKKPRYRILPVSKWKNPR